MFVSKKNWHFKLGTSRVKRAIFSMKRMKTLEIIEFKISSQRFLLIACSYRVESLKVVCWKSRWYFPLSYFLVWFDLFPQFYGKPLPFTSHVQSGSWCFRVFRQQGKIEMGKKGTEHYIIAWCNFIVSVLLVPSLDGMLLHSKLPAEYSYQLMKLPWKISATICTPGLKE